MADAKKKLTQAKGVGRGGSMSVVYRKPCGS